MGGGLQSAEAAAAGQALRQPGARHAPRLAGSCPLPISDCGAAPARATPSAVCVLGCWQLASNVSPGERP